MKGIKLALRVVIIGKYSVKKHVVGNKYSRGKHTLNGKGIRNWIIIARGKIAAEIIFRK